MLLEIVLTLVLVLTSAKFIIDFIVTVSKGTMPSKTQANCIIFLIYGIIITIVSGSSDPKNLASKFQ